MKWIGRILYTIFALVIGLFVLRFANLNKHYKFYEENGQIAINENNDEKYIQKFLTATLVEKYKKEPVYHLYSNNSTDPFDFYIYQALVEERSILLFHLPVVTTTKTNEKNEKINLYDQHLYDLIEDKDVYSKNKDYVRITLNIYMATFDENNILVEDENPIGEHLTFDVESPTRRMPSFGLLEHVLLTENDAKVSKFAYRGVDDDENLIDKKADAISRIEIILEDFTADSKSEDPVSEKTVLATITNDLNGNNGNDVLDLEHNSSGFNGLAEKHNFHAMFETENSPDVFVNDLSELDSYQGVVTKAVAIYVLILIVLTYIFFFLKPTMAYIQNRKYIQQKELHQNEVVEEKEEIQIFRDDK